MNKLDFYKEIYYKEIDRKSITDNGLTIPIGIITLLGTVLSNALLSFSYSYSLINSIIFIIPTCTTITFLIITINELVSAYLIYQKGYQYKYLDYSTVLYNYYSELKNYHIENSKQQKKKITNIEKFVDNEFEDYLIRKIVECNENNAKFTDKKIQHLFKAKKYLINSMISLSICVLPFGFNYFYFGSNKIIKIQFENPIEIKNYPEYIIKQTKKEKRIQLWRN